MRKTNDVTRLRSWKKLKSLGFRKVRFITQGVVYSIGASYRKKEGSPLEITIKHYKYGETVKGLDIRFSDHIYSKDCRYDLKQKEIHKELLALIHKIEATEHFTNNLTILDSW